MLNYKSFGEGFPLIILHGMFGTLDNWQGIAKQLADSFTVYIVDLRNHGRSPHTEEFGYELMCQDLREFMQDHWLHRAHILGHSMGGKVAMRFALEHGDMVDRLIVADIAPKAYVGNHEKIFDALFALDLGALRDRTEAAAFLRERIGEENTVQFLLKNLSVKKEGGFEWRMNLPVIHRYYAEILGHEPSRSSFEGPTLFLYGERSDYVNPKDLPLYQENFPHAQLKGIPNAGHWVHAEQPNAFLQAVLSFLLED